MSNLLIKNGYNGSHRGYGERVSKETRQKFVSDSKRSLVFPAIIHQDKQSLHRQVKPKYPQNRAVVISPDSDVVGFDYSSYSPSLIRDDSSDCMILFQDEITELKHLAVTLGIDTQHKSRGVLVGEGDSRWSPVKESKGEQWWKNSKKWIKHIEEQDVPNGHYETCKPNPNVTRTRRDEKIKNEPGLYHKGKKDEVYDALPENVEKNIRSVAIPGIGCSYRLPTINKKQKK